jgi:hypothetical protein
MPYQQRGNWCSRSKHFALTPDIARPLTWLAILLHRMDWRLASKVPDAMMQ